MASFRGGQFLPTTQLIDIESVSQNGSLNEDLKQIIIRISQALTDYANAINIKDTGMYPLAEFVTGQIYFPNPALNSTTPQTPVYRQGLRTTVNFGALPNTINKAVPHGITVDANTTFACIYATATNTTARTGLPIPSTSTTGNIVYLFIDATNVNITTNFDATAYNACLVVIEYIKQ